MARSSPRFYDAEAIAAHFDRINEEREKRGEIALHYAAERGRLTLHGTNNIGEPDEHNLFRMHGATLAYEGLIEAQCHLDGLSLHTRGERSEIRIAGYLSGDSPDKPVHIVAENGPIYIGSPGHPERKLIIYAHIEAEESVTIYKRQMAHCAVLCHEGDVVIRGQNVYDTVIAAPTLNISANACKNLTIHAHGDVMIKSSVLVDSVIVSKDGDVYVCSGSMRGCSIEAKRDIEINGFADESTLKRACSHKGVIHHDGRTLGGSAGKAEKSEVAVRASDAVRRSARRRASS